MASVLVPASGSVSAMQKFILPPTRGRQRSRFICSLPNFEMGTPPKMGLIMNSWPRVAPPPPAESSSTIRARSSCPRPEPPMLLRQGRANEPARHR